MDGREDGIYWKSSFLSFHDMVTLPFAGWSEKRMITLIGAQCTIGNMILHFITLQLTLHWLGLGVLLGTWPTTKLPNQIRSNHNQPNQRNVGKVIVSDLMPKDSIFSFHAQDFLFCLRKMTIDGRPRMTNQCQHLSLITRIVFVLCITKIYPRTLWPQPGGKRWMEDLSI